MKECGRCKKIKDLSKFYFRNNTQRYCSVCKCCEKKNATKWQQNNRDKVKESNRNWAKNNKEKKKESNKKYAEKNKDRKAEYDREYRQKNKEILKEKDRKKYLKNKDKIAKRAKKYRAENRDKANKRSRERRKNDIQYSLSCNLRNRVGKVIRGNIKTGSAVKDLGCSVVELTIHLEKQFQAGMSWENYGKWHIDHIKSLASFDLTDRVQFLEACHYTNLQPLWAEDNLSKGSKLIYVK